MSTMKAITGPGEMEFLSEAPAIAKPGMVGASQVGYAPQLKRFGVTLLILLACGCLAAVCWIYPVRLIVDR